MANQDVVVAGQQSLVLKTDDLSNVQRLGNLLAASGYFTDAREMAQAAVKVLAGQELGIPPIAAMMGINIIKGKVALGAHLIASRIRAHGYDFRFKRHDNSGCVLEFLSKPEGGKRSVLGESSFTEEDAKAAQCFTDMYKKYPRNMYYSRAVSNGSKWYCPEIFGGAPVYTAEELGAPIDSDGNALIVEDVTGIDTGGAPVNSQAAADEAAQQKLGKLRAARQPDPPPATAPAAAKSKGQEVPPDVLALWDRMTDFASSCDVFAGLKATIIELTGDEKGYREILAKHNMTAANDLKGKTRGQVKAAVNDLYGYVVKLQQGEGAAAPDAAVDKSDWLPEGLGEADAGQ